MKAWFPTDSQPTFLRHHDISTQLPLPLSCDFISPIASDSPKVVKGSPSCVPMLQFVSTNFYCILTCLRYFLQCPTFQWGVLQSTSFLSSLFCLQLTAEQEATCLVGNSVLHLFLFTVQCLFTSCRRENICACTTVFCHWWAGIDLDFLPLHSSCFPWKKKHLISLRLSWLDLAKGSKDERELDSWRIKMRKTTLSNPG